MANQDVHTSELIFAIVAPIGTDYEQVTTNLGSQIREFTYEPRLIKVSSFLPQLGSDFSLDHVFDESSYLNRVSSYIEGANKLYRAYNKFQAESNRQCNDLLAISAINQINSSRRDSNKESTTSHRLLGGVAHIISTLKRPEEIQTLRKVYGAGLHVIGVFATEAERVRFLTQQKHIASQDAEGLIKRDTDDQEEGGQRTRDAFHLADIFLDVGPVRQSRNWKEELGRFLDLLFSHPYHTPSLDEEAMFMAYAASLRSAQFGRQVGASIVSPHGEFLAIGCNEVPRPGGGQYREGEVDDQRDHIIGADSNDKRKSEIVDEIVLASSLLPKESERFRVALRKTAIVSITEYGRATHAEMEAILSCGRKGLSSLDASLFSTTFPCHNCARHIVAAGIRRVVYIEPYPKSQATSLHPDAIQIARDSDCENDRVLFQAFMGIGPRKYAELFTIRPTYGVEIERKLKNGDAIPWKREKSQLRIQMQPISFLERESFKLQELSQIYNDNFHK